LGEKEKERAMKGKRKRIGKRVQSHVKRLCCNEAYDDYFLVTIYTRRSKREKGKFEWRM